MRSTSVQLPAPAVPDLRLAVTPGQQGALVLEVENSSGGARTILWERSYIVDPHGGRHTVALFDHGLESATGPDLPESCNEYLEVLGKWRPRIEAAGYGAEDPMTGFVRDMRKYLVEACIPSPPRPRETEIGAAARRSLTIYAADRLFYDAREVCSRYQKVPYSKGAVIAAKVLFYASLPRRVLECMSETQRQERGTQHYREVRGEDGRTYLRLERPIPAACEVHGVPDHYYRCARRAYRGSWQATWLPPAELFRTLEEARSIPEYQRARLGRTTSQVEVVLAIRDGETVKEARIRLEIALQELGGRS